MGHYKSNVRDLEFNLFEVLDLEKALATGEFGDLDGESVREMLQEASRQAEGPLAESFADADRHPPTFDPETHTVSTARVVQEVAADLAARGVVPRRPGRERRRCARAVDGGVVDQRTRPRCPARRVHVPRGPDLREHPLRHRQRRAEALGGAGGRAQVGRHHGAHRTRRRLGRRRRPDEGDRSNRTAPGTSTASSGSSPTATPTTCSRTSFTWCWPARRVPVPGTKGLSLFLVPKYHFDPETGEIGDRNGVFVTGLEHKMGLKASATCELTFGQHGIPAVGWLVGDTHNGIAQMFKVIEYARMMVGTKAIATLSTGYLNALEYAKTRVQGADMTQMTDKEAPRVTIVHHPDVRRALLTQKAYAEGLRAVYLYTAAHQDDAVADIVSGADAATGRAGQRSAVADREGGGLRARVSMPDRVAANLRWIRLPAGLSDRAVHPRRQDRLALRGHHRDPGAGLLLPQDRARPGQSTAARGRPDRRLSSTATPRGPNLPTVARCWPPRSPTCRRWSPR